jgi:hypothetical protein
MKTRTWKVDRLSAFALLWAVATLIHQASFTGWISESRPTGWLVSGFAGMVIVWPRSIPLFATLASVSAIYTMQRLPAIPNHILFELFVNLTIVGGIAIGQLESRRRGLDRREGRDFIFDSFASAVRFEVLLLYFFVTLHKLNRDFFDPEVSCGGALFNMMVNNAPALASSSWVQVGCIVATIAFEAGIPLLLIFQRTRAIGILTGLVFHLILGFVPHGGVYSFSALMMTLLLLFTPKGLIDRFSQKAHSILARLPFANHGLLYRSLAVTGVGVTFGLWYWGWHRAGYLSLAKIGFAHWLAWSAVLLLAFLIAVTTEIVPRHEYHAELMPMHRLLWIFPILITLNALSPYLGSKTQTSFAMFSNLRTENGRPNHLFLSRVPQIWSYQRDIVEILETDNAFLEQLRQDDLRLPFFQFQSHIERTDEDFAVHYQRNGTASRIEKVNGQLTGDVGTWQPISYLAGKWLRFRPFDAGAKMECRH